jgi:hypothetical protein
VYCLHRHHAYSIHPRRQRLGIDVMFTSCMREVATWTSPIPLTTPREVGIGKLIGWIHKSNICAVIFLTVVLVLLVLFLLLSFFFLFCRTSAAPRRRRGLGTDLQRHEQLTPMTLTGP